MQRIIECSGLSDYRDQSPSIFLLDPETVESHCAVYRYVSVLPWHLL